MNRYVAIAAVLLATTAFVGADLAEAKRLGGGRSVGTQRQMTPAPSPNSPSAAPSTPSAPAQSMAPKAAPAAAPAASGASRWLGPIAGLAAGIGLFALFSHLGLSETFGSILLLVLLAGAAFFVIRLLMAKRGAPATRPLQYAGAGAGRVEPSIPRTGSAYEPVMGSATAPVSSSSRFPAGFDPKPFAEQAKLQFRKLQSAYDGGDRKALSEVMTPEMFAEISRELSERQAHLPTEIVRLDAEVQEVATEGDKHWMSVRFTGVLREDGTVLPKDFDETWNLVKPVDDSSGWLLAGIQQANEMA